MKQKFLVNRGFSCRMVAMAFGLVAMSVTVMSVTVGCVHKSVDSTSAVQSNVVSSTVTSGGNGTASLAGIGSDDETPVVKLQDISSFKIGETDSTVSDYSTLETVPVEINPMVEKWIAYFQGKGRPHMERYLSRSSRYIQLMKKILRQNGLPEDIIYIALIESGFASKITSRAAAVGYWQFIRGTGKRYGLEINSFVDERRDPVLSTQAAAEYFKGLYSVFGNWYLAMASYNVGENRVKKEVMKSMSRDFWELARKRSLPSETINYVPKFIAAKMIATDPAKYGFVDIDYLPPLEFESIKVDKPVNLRLFAEAMNLEYDEVKQLNPKYRGEIATLKSGVLELKIPVGAQATALAAVKQSFVDRVEFIADAGETKTYKVRPADSLNTIAKRFKTTVAWLRDNNDLKKGRKLRVGQSLQVPDLTVRKKVVVAKAEPKVEPKPEPKPEAKPEVVASEDKAGSANEIVTAKGTFYVVQAGDTLSEIANDYDSSVIELRKMNKLKRGVKLKVGMRIRVPKVERLPADPNGDKTDESDTDESDKSEPDTLNAEQRGGARRTSEFNSAVRTSDGISNTKYVSARRSVSADKISDRNKQILKKFSMKAKAKVQSKVPVALALTKVSVSKNIKTTKNSKGISRSKKLSKVAVTD